MSGYCRVTVTGPDRWADLALPGTVSVSTLMPQVVRVCSPSTDGLHAAEWTLATVDGTPIGAGRSLGEAGVVDGDVLLLSREPAPERPDFVDDVRGSVEDRVDETAWIWSPSTTLGLGLVLAAVLPLLVAATTAFLRASPLDLVAAPVGLAVSLGALWLARLRDLAHVPHALVLAACGWGALTAVLLVHGPSAAPPAPVVTGLFALVGALGAAAAAWSVDGRLLPYLAGIGVLTTSAGLLVGVGLFTDGPLAVRLLAVLLVLGIGAVPRTALALGGLSGLDYEVRQVGQTGTERFEDDFAASDRLLLGVLSGVVAAVVGAVVLLAVTGSGGRDLLLAALVSSVLLMRSRLFDRVVHVLPVRLGGVAGLAVVTVVAAQSSGWASALLPLAGILVGASVAGLSIARLTDVPRASLRRLLNGVEVVAVVGMCVVAVWALGVYDVVTQVQIGG